MTTPGSIAAHYDKLDAFYRELWGLHVHHGLWLGPPASRQQAQENLVRAIVAKARVKSGERLCDIGCGYGETARWIAKHTGAAVTAITISPAQHAFASKFSEADSNPTYLLGDWLEHTLADRSFDAALAIESTEHMADLDRFFRQTRRALRPAASLIISSWLAADGATRRQHRWLLDPITRESNMTKLRTAREYRICAEANGFVEQGFEDASAAVSRTWPCVASTFVRSVFSKPAYLRFLIGRHAANRRFARTILRICIAYRVRALRYGIFTFTAK